MLAPTADFISMKRQERPWYLREWRRHRKLSQEKLGAMVGLTQGNISHLETGEVMFNAEYISSLAQALNITTKQLMFFPPGEEDYSELFDSLSDKDRARAVELLKTFARMTS